MPADQMAKIFGCKNKTLYPYEHFGLEGYREVIGNLKKKTSNPHYLINYQHKKKSISSIMKTIIKPVKI